MAFSFPVWLLSLCIACKDSPPGKVKLGGGLWALTEAIGCLLFRGSKVFTDFVKLPVDVAFLSNANTGLSELHQENPELS